MSPLHRYTPKSEEHRVVWEYMNRTRSFSYDDIEAVASLSTYRIEQLVSVLKRRGILRIVGRKDRRQIMTVMDEVTSIEDAAQKRQSRNGAMWTTMRSLKVFTLAELLGVVADRPENISPSEAKTYCARLVAAKYLKILRKAKPGIQDARYQLVKDTGPLPPITKRVSVLIDQNDERVVHASGVAI